MASPVLPLPQGQEGLSAEGALSVRAAGRSGELLGGGDDQEAEVPELLGISGMEVDEGDQ